MYLNQKTKEYADITRIIRSKPAAPVTALPAVWQEMHSNVTGLSDKVKKDYVEAAQLFRYHATPLSMEALSALGKDFALSRYPDFVALESLVQTDIQARVLKATQQLFAEFGYTVPASFYNVLLEITFETETLSMDLFQKGCDVMHDRLVDAVVHALLLVTPIGLRFMSVLSQFNLKFTHIMDCGCKVSNTQDAPFDIALDEELKPAYLQNMLAAAFEQYGVNATTSATQRGF